MFCCFVFVCFFKIFARKVETFLLFFKNFVLLFLVWRENPKTLMCTSTFMLFPPFLKPQSLQQTVGSVSWKLAGIKQFGKARRKTKILFPLIPWEFIWKTQQSRAVTSQSRNSGDSFFLNKKIYFFPIFE